MCIFSHIFIVLINCCIYIVLLQFCGVFLFFSIFFFYFFSFVYFIILTFNFFKPIIFFYIYSFVCLSYSTFPLQFILNVYESSSSISINFAYTKFVSFLSFHSPQHICQVFLFFFFSSSLVFSPPWHLTLFYFPLCALVSFLINW